jgi:hypothetical protein
VNLKLYFPFPRSGRGRTFTLATLLAALAGCATQGDKPPAESAREELIYFENADGKYEKFATLLGRSPNGSVFFIRSRDGKSIAVCAGQPVESQPAPVQDPGAQQLLQTAFFQNCLARANGFIDEREFLRTHRRLVDAVATKVRQAEGAPGSSRAR